MEIPTKNAYDVTQLRQLLFRNSYSITMGLSVGFHYRTAKFDCPVHKTPKSSKTDFVNYNLNR